MGRTRAEGVIEMGYREAPAAVFAQRRRSVQERGRVGASGDRKHHRSTVWDPEASCALGQGVGDRLQGRNTTWRGVTAHF